MSEPTPNAQRPTPNVQGQIEFAITGDGGSQCDRIERMLRERMGEWVPMPELVMASGSYVVHSRIADLRKRGLTIEHRNERGAEGATHSFYKLVKPMTDEEIAGALAAWIVPEDRE